MASLTASEAQLSGGSVQLDRATLSQQLGVNAGAALVGGSLTAVQAMTLKAGGAVSATLVKAPTVDVQAGGDVRLNLLDANVATLATPTQIVLGEARIGQSITLRADQIDAKLAAVNGADLRTSAAGFGTDVAASLVKLGLTTPTRWIITDLDAVDASLSTLGSWTQFDKVSLSGRMTLDTPHGMIAVTNDKVERVPGADVQLYAPSGEFILLRDRQYAYTTAMALVYKPGQFVSAPNTMLSPLIVAQGGGQGGAGALAQALGAMALRGGLPSNVAAADYEELLRRAPTASGQDEELVGELEF